MAIQITAVRLSGGNSHEHITDLWGSDQATGATRQYTRAQLVTLIETKQASAFTRDSRGTAHVAVVTPARGAKYLRTHADGRWTDNLLHLPRR